MLVESSPVKYNWTIFIYLSDIDKIPPPPCPEGTLAWIEHEGIVNVLIPKSDEYVYEYVRENKPFMFDAEYDAQLNVIRIAEDFENRLLFEL
jgi:8-oxo-dGTP diphosphatase